MTVETVINFFLAKEFRLGREAVNCSVYREVRHVASVVACALENHNLLASSLQHIIYIANQLRRIFGLINKTLFSRLENLDKGGYFYRWHCRVVNVDGTPKFSHLNRKVSQYSLNCAPTPITYNNKLIAEIARWSLLLNFLALVYQIIVVE